ncbi:hypothetical protein SCOR_14595 [Sulfidibacter corallicola]|uniref:DUF4440 domain-containing protein n=1 Tax=Sulfidibacter corallicola TaxID=2818388 RepID=A0A8A4TY97_SULCO|nr:hypothetical protein [Sulfidibacter corallicola]QTD54307.1 hypothetical protein J3U87_17825 [Sulfidibacter corallicola]
MFKLFKFAALALTLVPSLLATEPAPGADEAKPEEVQYEIIGETAAVQHKEALEETIRLFWQKTVEGDLTSIYGMYVESYRKAVPLKDFIGLNRGEVSDVELDKIWMWGDGCAYVKIYHAMKTEFMEFPRFPTRQRWVWNEDKWQLYQESAVGGFVIAPKSKKVQEPCPLPEKLRSKVKKKPAKAAGDTSAAKEKGETAAKVK